MPDILAAPGQALPVTWPLGSPGIAAQLQYKVVNQATDAVFYAASGTGIAERDTGIYSIHSFTFPSTAGAYLGELTQSGGIVWTDSILVQPLAVSTPIILPGGGVSPVVTQSFFIKRGDTEPLIFAVTELNASGTPVLQNVTGWTGRFKMRITPDVGSVVINQPFYISDALGQVTTDGSLGLLAYGWPNTGETDRLGTFLAEFECHRADGTKKTYPTTSDLTREYITVLFVADLDDAGSH